MEMKSKAADQPKYTVMFSQDRSLYYVRELAFKHAWLSVEAHPEPPKEPRLVMPFSGLCAFDRAGARYFRLFLNQSYFNVRLGDSEVHDSSSGLVLDYADAAAFVPLEEANGTAAAQKAAGSSSRKSRKKEK